MSSLDELFGGQSSDRPGIKPYKTAEEAYRQDVLPRASEPFKPKSFDELFGAPPAAQPTTPAPAKDSPDFSRGIEVSGKQLKQSAYGTAALVGDTFGVEGLKQWGLKGYQEAEKEVQAISKESDSFTNAVQSGELGKWFTYSAGYLLGQFGEMAVAGVAGAALGSAVAPGAGTVAGGIAGAANRAAVQTGIRAAIGKMIEKEAASRVDDFVVRGMAKEAAEKAAAEAAVKSVYRTIGATTANTFLNATQELGSIYGDAVEQSALTGEEYSLGKVWLSGVAATAVDSWADSKAVGGLFKAFGGGKPFKGVAMEALKGGFRESLTEGVQTVIERWGADKDLASKEAFKEYIDSAAVGFLGGGIVGTATGTIKKLGQTPDNTAQDTPNLTGTTGNEQNTNLSQSFAPSMSREELAQTLTTDGFGAALAAASKDTTRGTVIVQLAKELGVYDEMRRQYADPETREAGKALLDANPDYVDQFVRSAFGYALGSEPRIIPILLETTPGPFAALYTQSNPTEQQVIRQAFERAGIADVLGATLANPEAIRRGKEDLESMRQDDGFGAMLRSLEQFAQTQSRPGEIVKADKRDSLTGKVQDQNTAPPDDVDLPQGDTSLEINEEEGVFRQSDETEVEQTPATRDEIIARFNKIGEKIRGYQDEARQSREMTSAGQALQQQGFSFMEAARILTGELRPQADSGQTQRIDNDPRLPRFLELSRITSLAEKESDPRDWTPEQKAAYESGDWRKFSELRGYTPQEIADYAEYMDLANALIDQYGVDEVQSVELDSAETKGMKPGGASSKKVETVDEAAPPTPKTEAQQANENLKDALANLGDVLTDALGTKLNMGGQRYTMADVPAALTKVMSALLKAGYVQFKDAAAELMKRMRANKDWAPLANKVDQGMLLKAWKAAGGGKPDTKPAEASTKAKPAESVVEEERDDENVTYQRKSEKKSSKPARQTKKPVAQEEDRKPREQLRLGLPVQDERKGEPTLITQMRKAIDAKIREMTNASYFEDSIRYLQTKIAEIDSRLKELGTVNIEGQTYRVRSDEDERPALWGSQDENAYDRFEGGMVFDKKTPKNALLDLRRKLSEDLRVARIGSQKGQARLYTLGMDRLGDFVMQRAQSAIRGGVAPEVVQAAVRPYLDGIMALRNANAIEQDVEPAIDQALAEANRNLAQGDFFDGQRVAAGLLADFRAKLINRNELEQLEQRGLREGDFTLSDLLGAYEALGISPEQRLYAGMKHFSARIRMEDYVAQHGGSVSAMDAWLMDMAQAQKVLSPAQFDKIYSLKEWGRLEFWKQSRQEILSRRNVTRAMRESDSPRIAFRGFLFTRITLEEARNPATIRNASLRQNLTGLFDNLEEAWFQDVAVALRRRPSLANGIFDYRVDGKAFSVAMEGVLSPQEQQAFRDWVARIKAGNQKQAEVMARVPFFEVLRNDLSLEAVRTAEGAPVVASTPVADADQTGLSADLEANRGRASPRTEYEGLYARIVNGEFDTVQALMDSANRFKALRAGMLDADGVLITDQAADELNAEMLESIQMNAQMESSYDAYGNELSQFGARIQGDQRVSRTVEEAAARDAQVGDQASVSTEDLSSEEQIQEGALSEFDGETTENALDENSEQESGAAEQGPAAEQSNEETLVFSRALADRNIPMTLEGGAEYRFRRGPAWDLLSGSLVQDAVNRLTAGWKNAPNITVLPNAQHLPEPLRSRVLEKLAQDGAKGLYHEGTIYLFSQHLTGEADVEFTLFHEAYGHLGLRAVLGQKFDDFLNMAYRTNAAVRKAADDLIAQGMPKLEAIDEVLSDMAAANRQDSAVKSWVSKVISGVRSIGLESVADWMESITGAQLATVLSAARKAVRNGTYSPMSGDLSGTRFRREKFAYEMFATKNGKSTGYARYNPITDSWVVFSADGDELSTGYTTRVFDKFEDAEQQIRYSGSVQYRLRHGLYIDDRIAPDLVQLKKQKDDTKYSLWDRRHWARLWRTATIGFQNQYLPAFEIVDQLIAKGRLSPSQYSLKTALTLTERRTGSRLDKFKTDYVRPITSLLEQIGKLGVTKADVDRYLVARHTKERNDHVARINPGMKDGGSGLTYKEAEEIIKKVESSPAAGLMLELGRKFDQMSKEKIGMLYSAGLITDRAFQAMNIYEHYVNLGGSTDADEDAAMIVLGGSKFNAQKPSEKRAFGRGAGNEATDVVARTLLSFESAVVRAEKNRVALSVLTMMEVNLDPSFVLINGQPRIRRLNEETGLVEEAIDENYYGRDDVMVARVNGVPVTMEFKEKGFGTFADAIHGKVAPIDPMSAMELVGKVSRFLGSLLTTYNPVFTAVNFMRDVQSMYLQAVTDKKISLAMANQMLGALPQAIRVAMMAATNGRLNLGLRPNDPMVLAYREMKANGGLTFFADRKNLDEQIEEINDLMNGKSSSNLTKALRTLPALLEMMADVSEIAPRLAAYSVVKNNGFTTTQAAVFSGEITVNFNMRGSFKAPRQLFVFFNPAIQGTEKIWRLAKQDPRKFAAVSASMMAMGLLVSMIGRAASGDDDEGRDNIDKLPLYKRATSMVFKADAMGGAPIPVPYGWNVPYATGVFLMDWLYGKQDMKTTASRIAKTAVESFAPIGSGALDSKDAMTFALKFFSPTAILPVVEYIANENRFGAPIYKADSLFGKAEAPDSQRYFRGVSPISRAMTDFLNKETGGNAYKGGAIDINPATVDHIIRSYLPGMPSEAYKLASVAVRKASGERVKSEPWPLLDRFSARVPDGYETGSFMRAAKLIETAHREFKEIRDPERRQEILAEFPNIGMAHSIVSSTEYQLRGVRKQINDLEKRSMTQEEKMERKTQLLDREDQILSRANARLLKVNDKIRSAMMNNE